MRLCELRKRLNEMVQVSNRLRHMISPTHSRRGARTMKGDHKFAPLFSVWQIDAWAEGESGWVWNDKFKLFEFRTTSLNVKQEFLRRLRYYLEKSASERVDPVHGFGNGMGRGWYCCTGDWHVLEVCRKTDGCPCFACIRETPS